jgi:hypothetical protein
LLVTPEFPFFAAMGTQPPPNLASISDIFVCTRCGFCCQGQTTVSLNEADQERMVQHLNLPQEEVARRFWRITGSVVQMQVQDGHCIFYEAGHGCSVHAGRPWRCRQWPLHPSILSDENNFQSIAESCPGLKTSMGYAAFCRILRQLLEDSSSLAQEE